MAELWRRKKIGTVIAIINNESPGERAGLGRKKKINEQ